MPLERHAEEQQLQGDYRIVQESGGRTSLQNDRAQILAKEKVLRVRLADTEQIRGAAVLQRV